MVIGILILLGLISLVILWAICRVASDADDTMEEYEHDETATQFEK